MVPGGVGRRVQVSAEELQRDPRWPHVLAIVDPSGDRDRVLRLPAELLVHAGEVRAGIRILAVIRGAVHGEEPARPRREDLAVVGDEVLDDTVVLTPAHAGAEDHQVVALGVADTQLEVGQVDRMAVIA